MKFLALIMFLFLLSGVYRTDPDPGYRVPGVKAPCPASAMGNWYQHSDIELFDKECQ